MHKEKKVWCEPKLVKGENYSFVNVTAAAYAFPDPPADPPGKKYHKHHHGKP